MAIEEVVVTSSAVAAEAARSLVGAGPGAISSWGAAHFTGASWIKGDELYPGIEYAAHCVGNVLWGYGAYTKCPDATMREYASYVVTRASR